MDKRDAANRAMAFRRDEVAKICRHRSGGVESELQRGNGQLRACYAILKYPGYNGIVLERIQLRYYVIVIED